MEGQRPVFDLVRHMVRIGEHPEHKALRERYEARFMALKASGKLTEDAATKLRTIFRNGEAVDNESFATIRQRVLAR